MSLHKLPHAICDAVSKLEVNQCMALYLEFLERYLKREDRPAEGSEVAEPLENE